MKIKDINWIAKKLPVYDEVCNCKDKKTPTKCYHCGADERLDEVLNTDINIVEIYKLQHKLEIERRTHWIMADKYFKNGFNLDEGFNPTDFVCESRKQAEAEFNI